MLAFAVMSKAHTLTGPTFVGHSRVICYAHPICIRPLETDQVVALEVDSGKSQWLAIPLGLLGALALLDHVLLAPDDAGSDLEVLLTRAAPLEEFVGKLVRLALRKLAGV